MAGQSSLHIITEQRDNFEIWNTTGGRTNRSATAPSPPTLETFVTATCENESFASRVEDIMQKRVVRAVDILHLASHRDE